MKHYFILISYKFKYKKSLFEFVEKLNKVKKKLQVIDYEIVEHKLINFYLALFYYKNKIF